MVNLLSQIGASLIVALFAWWDNKERSRKLQVAIIVAFILSCFIAYKTYDDAAEAKKQGDEAQKKNEASLKTIDSLNKKIFALSEATIDSSGVIIFKQNTLNLKQNELNSAYKTISKLQNSQLKELRGYVYEGFDNYAYFDITLPLIYKNGTSYLKLMLCNYSDKPIYGVNCRYVNLYDFREMVRTKTFLPNASLINNGSMEPTTCIDSFLIDTKGRDTTAVNFFLGFRNRNGVMQEIRAIKMKSGRVAFASRIRKVRKNGKSTSEDEISNDFPGYDGKNADAIFAFKTR